MAVVHGRDALSEATLERLSQYIEERRKAPVWNRNQQFWDAGFVHLSAPVLVHAIEARFSNELLAELHLRGKRSYLHHGETVMCYAWSAGSCIPEHSDFAGKCSMTIHLNLELHADHGGALCWQDCFMGIERHDWSAVPPQCQTIHPGCNAYALMTDTEWHCVTMTMSNAPVRLTLQRLLPQPKPDHDSLPGTAA